MTGFLPRGRRRRTVAAEMPAEYRNLNIRRNFSALIVDAAGWPLGQSFLSPQTVLPMFIAILSKSNFTIGLVVAIQSIVQLVIQLLASNRAERMPVKRFFIVVVGVLLERLPYLVLAAGTLLITRADLLLLIFFLCWTTANVGVGVNLPVYIGLFAKVMPPALRGRLTGVGNSVGTLLAVGGAYATSKILENSPGARGFAWVFIIGFVVLTVTVLPFLAVNEPAAQPRGPRPTTRSYLRELPVILRTNRPFARYVIMQITLQFVFGSTPFITGYAALKLGASPENVGIFTGIFMAASAVGSFLFGLVADARGYRQVMSIGAIISALTFAVMALSPRLEIVWICYFLAGLAMSAVSLGNNMSMEYSGPEKAVTYSTIMYSAGAPIRAIGPLLLGLLADHVSMTLVFVLVTLASLYALYVGLFRLTDPRLVKVRS